MEITGGFVSFLRLEDEANLIVHEGFLDSVVARGNTRVHLEKVYSNYVSVGDEALMTITDCIQPGDGQALANGNGVMKIGGGTFGRAYTSTFGGRIEVDGSPKLRELNAYGGGVVIQNGGTTGEIGASGTGIALLQNGSVSNGIYGDDRGTIYITGGTPPEDIRLFRDSKLVIFHNDNRFQRTTILKLDDFQDPGLNLNFAGREFLISMGSSFQRFRVSGWQDGEGKWDGEVRMIKVDQDTELISMRHANQLILAFYARGDQVVQPQMSVNLREWENVGGAAIGEDKPSVRIVPVRNGQTQYFRLRYFSIPNW